MRGPSLDRATTAPDTVTRKSKPTLRDVASHLGLSPATISLVLNRSKGSEAIPEATQKRVFQAARELGYRPDYIARSLRSRRSNSIGVLVPELSEPYAAEVLSGIESFLLRAGYHYLVTSHRRLRSRLDEDELDLFAHRAVDGIIRVGTEIEHESLLPTVTVSGHNRIDGVTNVVVDHDRAAQLALSHLRDLGHRRIAVFEGEEGSADTEERIRAIVATGQELDLEISPEHRVKLASAEGAEEGVIQDQWAAGYRCGRQLLESGNGFTALFAFNDTSAMGAIRSFIDAGLSVPRDVSVVGFDDIRSAAFHNPRLTTVRQPLREMGRRAAEVLLDILGNGGSGHDAFLVYEPELIVRDSTGMAPNGDGSSREREER